MTSTQRTFRPLRHKLSSRIKGYLATWSQLGPLSTGRHSLYRSAPPRAKLNLMHPPAMESRGLFRTMTVNAAVASREEAGRRSIDPGVLKVRLPTRFTFSNFPLLRPDRPIAAGCRCFRRQASDVGERYTVTVDHHTYAESLFCARISFPKAIRSGSWEKPPVKYWPGLGPLDILPLPFSPELDRLDEIGMLIKDWQTAPAQKKGE
jgi:hypothetical protein